MPPSNSLFRKILLTLSPCGAVTAIPCPKISQRKYLNDTESWDPSTILFYFLVLLLHYAFVVIAVYMVLDSVVLIISLGFRYARSVQFPADPAKLETPSTYINF
jgi:hypothetical protein